MKTVVIIPARLDSSRLSNKVILGICGKLMVQHVYEAAKKANNIVDVYITTDSKEVEEKCRVFTSNIIMTSKEHESGTDRLAEAVANIECGNVINVQGDEPLIDSKLIEELATTLESTETKGGEGVLRDVADYILDAQDILDKILKQSIQRKDGYNNG